ncbi:MAG: SAM-dependent methyltransferase [Chthoniobacterales bacterium]
MSERSRAVWKVLKPLQDETGNIRWDHFMQAALYDAELGYYTKNINAVGPRGDFSTLATLNNTLGKTIAQWGNREQKQHAKHLPWIEFGPGGGNLAVEILHHIPLLRRYLTPRGLVEVSSSLRQIQQRKLRWQRCCWFSSPTEAIAAHPQGSLLYSNELIDAFPCRIFRRSDSGWEELFLKITEAGIGECFLSVAEKHLPESSVFESEISKNWQIGQRVEVHESFKIWLQNFLPKWRGSMLTIDYGGEPKKIYHRRLRGTLRAYWKQQRFTGSDCYMRFGLQDLTADVNFQDINTWMSQFGAELIWQGSLQKFINQFGKDLTTPSEVQEATEAFHVIWHRR